MLPGARPTTGCASCERRFRPDAEPAHRRGRIVAERVGLEPTEGLNTPHLLSRKALSTGLSHLSKRRSLTIAGGPCRGAAVGRSERSDGRVDEGGGLENRWPARVRGFESLSLRYIELALR